MNDYQKPMAEHRSIWQDAGIPPLDYCTIERASKLLSCEIDDIWHWRERYYIDFYIYAEFLDFIEVNATIHFKRCGDAISDLLLLYPDDVDFAFPFLINKNIVNAGVAISRDETGIDELFYAHKPIDIECNVKCFEKSDGNAVVVNKAIACGLLRVSGTMVRNLHPNTAGEAYVRLVATFDCDLYRFKMQSGQIHLSSLADKNIYLTKADIECLYDARLNGRFDSVQSNKRREMATAKVFMQEMKSSSHSAERHAANREKLFKSAIYILSKYPDECRGKQKEISPEKWRDCIQSHKDEIPPLAITNEDVILRHLRSAANGKG
ncbi:hypothetical protein [Enterobacter roggenkampii]|uniref:hypothetical protein n=1 Tax=Enterobacter roggenkampii TaxID=1812935 RepID=UPI00352675E7